MTGAVLSSTMQLKCDVDVYQIWQYYPLCVGTYGSWCARLVGEHCASLGISHAVANMLVGDRAPWHMQCLGSSS